MARPLSHAFIKMHMQAIGRLGRSHNAYASNRAGWPADRPVEKWRCALCLDYLHCCYTATSTCRGDGNYTCTSMNVLSYLHIITLAAASNRHANVALKETIRSFPNRRSGSRWVTLVARSRKNQFWIQFLNIQSKKNSQFLLWKMAHGGRSFS